MEKIQVVKLIEGTFSIEDAKEIVVRLLNDKINFHKLKNFSSYEQQGAPLHSSVQRIESLLLERDKVFNFLESQNEEGFQIVIDAHVYLKKIKKEKIVVENI